MRLWIVLWAALALAPALAQPPWPFGPTQQNPRDALYSRDAKATGAIKADAANGTLTSPLIVHGRGLFGGNPETWLQTLSPGTAYPIVTPFVSLAPPGGVGAAAWFGMRVSDAAQATFPATNCFVFADVNPNHYATWCSYVEADLTSTVPGYNINAENSTYSLWTPVYKNPWNVSPLGGNTGQRIDCGKGVGVLPPAQNCSTALEILNNGARYLTGILFSADALQPSGDGLGEAMALAPSQAIKFHYTGDLPAWSIVYTGTGTSYGNTLQLNDAGMVVSAPLTATTLRATSFIAPTTSSQTCAVGQQGTDAGFFYACTGTNHWKRVPLADF